MSKTEHCDRMSDRKPQDRKRTREARTETIRRRQERAAKYGVQIGAHA